MCTYLGINNKTALSIKNKIILRSNFMEIVATIGLVSAIIIVIYLFGPHTK